VRCCAATEFHVVSVSLMLDCGVAMLLEVENFCLVSFSAVSDWRQTNILICHLQEFHRNVLEETNQYATFVVHHSMQPTTLGQLHPFHHNQ